jgi:hypothetical protein
MEEKTKLTIKSFKIKVTPKQARIVQEVLFKNGYTWRTGDKRIRDSVDPHLYFYNDGDGLSYSGDNTYFESHPNKEISFNEFNIYNI